jgi:hypothetical protein
MIEVNGHFILPEFKDAFVQALREGAQTLPHGKAVKAPAAVRWARWVFSTMTVMMLIMLPILYFQVGVPEWGMVIGIAHWIVFASASVLLLFHCPRRSTFYVTCAALVWLCYQTIRHAMDLVIHRPIGVFFPDMIVAGLFAMGSIWLTYRFIVGKPSRAFFGLK